MSLLKILTTLFGLIFFGISYWLYRIRYSSRDVVFKNIKTKEDRLIFSIYTSRLFLILGMMYTLFIVYYNFLNGNKSDDSYYVLGGFIIIFLIVMFSSLILINSRFKK